jgi:uncharacterized protein (DUF433 family)
MSDIDWSDCDLVESIPGRVSGAWCLKNSRMPVQTIIDNYDAGMSPEDLAAAWEGVTLDQVKGVLAYARPQPDAPREPSEGEKK